MGHKNITWAAVVALACVFALPAVLRAEEGQGPADENATIDGIQFGQHWFGPEISHKDLKGKVVLLEIWGQ